MNATLSTLLSSSRAQNLAAFLSLLSVLWFFFFDLSAANWRADDTQILVHALNYPVLENFYSAEVWRQFSPSNLTPWIVLSFKADYLIFGITPSGFYLHQVFSILAAALACFILLRLWLQPRFAFAASLLFLFGLPVTDAANNLMTRHYVEGLVFASFAVYFGVRFLREDRSVFAACSVLFYAFSMCAKEVYVPLVLLVPLMSDGTLRTRSTLVVAFFATAVLYTLWRGYMLSGFVGGYTSPNQFFELDYWLVVLTFVGGIPGLLLGSYWLPIVLGYLAALSLVFLRKRKMAVVFAGIALLELLPLVPLANVSGINYPGRYYFLVWFSFCCSLGFCLCAIEENLAWHPKQVVRRGVIGSVFLLMLVPVFFSRSQFAMAIASSNSEFDVQGEFMWEHKNDSYFLPSQRLLEAFWFVRGMQQLKLMEDPAATSPNVILDSMFLSKNSSPLFEYDSECACMVDVSETLSERLAQHEASLNISGPLKIEISFQNNLFRWNFGPYKDSYYYLFSDYLGVLNFPSAGEFYFSDIEGPIEVRVGHFPPGGLKTYSEPLLIEQEAATLVWSK